MSNNVIFNLDELFISVGIDVGADLSWMSITLPNQQLVGKPYKILHSSMNSLTTAVSKIKEADELYSLESRIFLESTGLYHYPLFCYLRGSLFPPLAALTFAASSIICAFGLASAAPRSPYRHLELCGIALAAALR